MLVYELIIIGGGPAGMTAAVYAARKRMKALMVMKEFGGQPMWTMDIENYMGYQFVTGPELMDKFDEQVKKFPIEIKYEEVTGLTANADGTFTVTSDGRNEYQAQSVIIASGKRPRRLEVPGEAEFTGRGVSYCATCDGPLFTGKKVAVIGGGNSAVQAAIEVSGIAEKVYLITLSGYKADPIVLEKLRKLEKPVVEMMGYTTKAVKGDQFVEKLDIVKKGESNEIELDVQGVFVEIGLIPNSEYCEGLIDFNKYREVVTDCRARTGIPGLFAAGDVTNGPDKQIVIAAGDGAKAALAAYEYLLNK